MDECSGRPFWNFCLDFLTTPLMSITICCDFSDQLFCRKSHKPCWFGAETKGYPSLPWQALRLDTWRSRAKENPRLESSNLTSTPSCPSSSRSCYHLLACPFGRNLALILKAAPAYWWSLQGLSPLTCQLHHLGRARGEFEKVESY